MYQAGFCFLHRTRRPRVSLARPHKLMSSLQARLCSSMAEEMWLSFACLFLDGLASSKMSSASFAFSSQDGLVASQ